MSVLGLCGIIYYIWWLVSRTLKTKRDNDRHRRIEANSVEMNRLLKRHKRASRENIKAATTILKDLKDYKDKRCIKGG
ncbi:hypothetical protein LCGC14_0969340 [marine sediment metagenome]|uniref:Uncharacterized protein n=1 Tax=marine sediment metagenome TaxID=412755 RepID=A0A0F9NY99_9ZZZZ